MKFIGKALFIFIILSINCVTVWADWTPDTKIKDFYFGRDGVLQFKTQLKGKIANPYNCQNLEGAYFRIYSTDSTDPQYIGKMFSMVLAAKMSNSTISVFTDGCAPDGYNKNVVYFWVK